MDRAPPADPYSPPGSDLNAGLQTSPQGYELAGRGTRLWAAMIDGFLFSLPLWPMVAVGTYFGLRQSPAFSAAMGGGGSGSVPFGDETVLVGLGGTAVLGCLGALAIAIYQWVLISRTGQSLGKKWNGIRIERLDGGRVTFGIGVFLRNWVPKLIGSVPYLGGVFQLVNCLFIFRDDRRCIHDHIAGTRVVCLSTGEGAGWGPPPFPSPTLPRSGSAGRSPATPTRR